MCYIHQAAQNPADATRISKTFQAHGGTAARCQHTEKHTLCNAQSTRQAAQIPADATSISEMIKLMDGNRDGRIGWGEFESFMMQV